MRKFKIYIAQDQQLEEKFKIQYDVLHNQTGNQSDRTTLSLYKSLVKSQLIMVINMEWKSKMNFTSVIYNIY